MWEGREVKAAAETVLRRRATQQSLKTLYGCDFSEGAWLAASSQQCNK